jgi:pseudaminic acid cytidylyltransferase
MNLAIIPARGGSKRIPKKNIKLFHGKPIIAYSIESAIKSGCFSQVIVSTDDEEIADVAREFGASVPFVRPADLSDDYATTWDVIKHAASWALNQSLNIHNICCIYATAPLISIDDIKLGLNALEADGYDFAFSATDFSYPIQRAFTLSSCGGVELMDSSHEFTRSQDLVAAYHDAGQFYWGTAHSYMNGKSIFAGNSLPIILPRMRVQDIDSQEDWDMAEKIYSLGLHR